MVMLRFERARAGGKFRRLFGAHGDLRGPDMAPSPELGADMRVRAEGHRLLAQSRSAMQ